MVNIFSIYMTFVYTQPKNNEGNFLTKFKKNLSLTNTSYRVRKQNTHPLINNIVKL